MATVHARHESLPPVIAITGFMASGKTEAGRALADLLGLDFMDTDGRIEAAAEMPIAQIFEKFGEARFRHLEERICKELEGRSGIVVATGGGMLLNPDIFRFFSERGTLVLLEASVESLTERLRDDTSRPVLAPSCEDPDEALPDRIRRILAERRHVYERIDIRVDTSHRTAVETATAVAVRLKVPHETLHVVASDGSDHRGRFGTSEIRIGRGMLASLGEQLREFDLAQHAFVLVPRSLERVMLPSVGAALSEGDVPHTVIFIDDGDAHKTLAQSRSIIDRLLEAGASRDSVIVPVGGGVTGDIGGFVASVFMRGIPLVHVPTTLMAQVDSSIGGKVGVNHETAKNMIGSFYQPHFVISDPCVMRSLPAEEICNGLAEVIKSALIASPTLFEYLQAQTDHDATARLRNIEFLERCVRDSASIKVEIVNRDPYERDVRRHLNLGHTIGHALESITGYSGLTHGQAVSLGLIAALHIAVARGMIEENVMERTTALLRWCRLPVAFERVADETLLKTMQFDKKVKAGKTHFVLPTGIGSVTVVDDVTEREVLAAMDHLAKGSI